THLQQLSIAKEKCSMSNPDDPKTWMQKVEEDLLAIESILAGSRIPWAVVAFHAQQAAEKSLKALLVSRGDTVPHTHDLEALIIRCAKQAVPLPQLIGDCDLLT